jgi:O-acetyl-ADP-ribose deacetylase (regulator of RNase III)
MSKIEIINGSSVNQEVDAIVNAANKYLMSGSGVCGAIYKEAGYNELNEACSKIQTPLNDGDAVITPAFNIKNAKYIIHSVGPDFGRTPEAFDKLFLAYYNSLKVLKDNNLHSISFPLISSGIYGGNLNNPAKISASECIKAYNQFINDYKDYDIEVKLCAYSNNEYQEIKDIY